jgi:hypothetical protein
MDEQLCLTSLPTNLSGDYYNPPCCSHLLRDMLLDVGTWMEQYGVEYWVHFGTLLGIIREGTIFSWTADIDMAVELSHWERLCKIKQARYDLWDLGYNFFDEGNNGERYMGRICFHDYWRGGILSKWPKPLPRGEIYVNTYIYMDIYLGQIEYEGYRTYPVYNKWLPEDIWPIKILPFSGRFVPVPQHPENILNIYYGNWTVRLKEAHGRGYKGYGQI